MARLITQLSLREMVRQGNIIVGGIEEAAEGVKYDFRFGQHFLKAKYGVPLDYSSLSSTEKASAVIEPGEVVFVLTEEHLSLPNDMIIVLSQKRKISHDGISVLGGSCVDPGYRGRLLVGLYNFSSQPFRLQPGKKLIAGVFYRLEGEEKGEFPLPAELENFPDDLVKLISAYQPINIVALGDQIQP